MQCILIIALVIFYHQNDLKFFPPFIELDISFKSFITYFRDLTLELDHHSHLLPVKS